MKDKKISMKEIAQKCGVGIGTISRYFNGGYVSQEKRALIKKVVAEYNFQPNFAARSIKKKIKEIYILIPDLTSSNTFITKAILAKIYEQFSDLVVFIIETTYDQERYLLHLQQVIQRHPVALILFSITNDDQIKSLLQILQFPIIVYGRQWGKNVFINDDLKMMHDLLEKMAANNEFTNQKPIIYIGETPKNIPTGAFRFNSVKNWVTNKKYQLHSYFFDKNDQQVIWKLLSNINFENSIIICGTHTCYKTVITYLLQNKINNFVISDIKNKASSSLLIGPNYYLIAINYELLATKIVEQLKIILQADSKINTNTQIQCLDYEIIVNKNF